MSSIDITGIIDKMTELYADEFDEFELTSSDNGLICRTVDIYNIENKCLYRINADVSEEELTEDIRIWLDKLVRCSKNVVRLNNWLEDKSNGFNIQYRFIQGEKARKNSYIVDWGYSSVKIALSLKSIDLLDKYINTLEDMEEEYAGYKNLAEFVSKFIESDYILKLLDISFNSNNILLVMEENQLNKEELLNKLKSTSHTGIVTARTVLVSKNLGVLCRINWVIDFNSIDLKVAFDENRIFSTRDMKFIMDKEILDGMLKLYKPNISDIF